MILDQGLIDEVLRPKMRRRMLRLPAMHESEFGAELPCPVELGQVLKLQPRPGARALVTVTVVEVRREKLAAVSLADARREGFASVRGAVEAWGRYNGQPSEHTMVWVVGFVRGNHAGFMHQDDPVYLARNGDYTTQRARAVMGEGEVAIIPGAGEKARVLAIARRTAPHREEAQELGARAGVLSESLIDMKARRRAKLIAREAAKLAAELPSGGALHCG